MCSQPINELERKKMAKTRQETARAARREARAQIERLQRERRRVDQRIYTGAIIESVSKNAQLATVVAECEEINYGMRQLKGSMETMEKQIEAIKAWTERMVERMENGENYTDAAEVSPEYSAKEMLDAMTEKVGAVASSSRGRAVTLETYVKGEFVSISVTARDGEGGTNAQAGPVHYRASRGRKADGPYLPRARGGFTGGGEAQMDCSGNKSGEKRKR